MSNSTRESLAAAVKRLAAKLGDVRQDGGTGTPVEASAVQALHAAIDALAAAAAPVAQGELPTWQPITEADLRRVEEWLGRDGDIAKRALFVPAEGQTLANLTLHMIREVRATRAALSQVDAPAQQPELENQA